MTSTALRNCKFCFSGALSETRSKMQALVAKHGASFGQSCTMDVTHLVTTSNEVMFRTIKVMNAEKWGIPIVSEKFVRDSIAKKALQPVGKYLLSEGGGESDDDDDDDDEEEEGGGPAAPSAMGIFAGMTFLIVGKLFSRSLMQLESLLLNNGGKHTDNPNTVGITLAIHNPNENHKNFNKALEKGIPLVTEKWLNDSLLNGKAGPVPKAAKKAAAPSSAAASSSKKKGKAAAEEEDDDEDEDDEGESSSKPAAKKAKKTADKSKVTTKTGAVGQALVEKLCAAAYAGDDDEVESALDSGANINGLNTRGQTALYCAARQGHSSIVVSLLAREADLTITDSNKSTPLHGAAFGGHTDCCVSLVQEGANPLVKNKYDLTPIDEARMENHKETVRALAAECLCSAAFNGAHSQVVQILALVSGEVNEVNERGQTALYCAAREGKASIVRLLLDAGARHDLADANGSTPLHAAAFFGHADCCKALLDAGASRVVLNKFKMTPAAEALAGKNKTVIALFQTGTAPVAAPTKAKKGAATAAKPAAAPAVVVLSSTTTTSTAASSGSTSSSSSSSSSGSGSASSSTVTTASTEPSVTTTTTTAAPSDAAGGASSSASSSTAPPPVAEGPVDNSHLCVVCIDAPSVMATYPCGHRCLCKDCATAVKNSSKKCPLCNGVMKDIIHVYM